MLQRRYDLASHQPSGQWVNGMATSGAGDLKYTTTQQAQKAGANAGQQFMDGKISASQFLALLREHEGDPDWQTGAMRALGQQGLWDLKEDDAIPYGSAGQSDIKALALAVAAAMANGVTFPDPDEEDPKSEDISLLAPLLQYANFPPQVLATLGKEAMSPGNNVYAPEVWAALAANPEAAAMFVQQNATQIVWYIHDGDHGGGLPSDETTAFFNVIKAGTLDIKNTDPKLGGQAVTALVQAYDNNSDAHAPGQFEALYGQVIKAYWPDVMFSLTAPASADDPHGYLTSPDGMRLTPAQWAPFIQEAMRDPKTSAMLLDIAHAQGSQWENVASQLAGGPDAGDSYEFDAGVVDGYFDYQAEQVYNQLGSEAGAWKNSVANYIGDFVGIGVDVVADPGAAAKTITVGITKDVITDVLQKGLDAIPTDGPPPPPQYSSWQGSWQSIAAKDFNNSDKHNLAGNPSRQALVASAAGQPFLVNGKIPATSKMTRQQLEAYNAWLNTPAVAQYLIATGGESAWIEGYDSTVTQESFGSG
jgi:hypothetical protein